MISTRNINELHVYWVFHLVDYYIIFYCEYTIEVLIQVKIHSKEGYFKIKRIS